MGENKKEKTANLTNDQRIAVENMHKTFLEALRHREQEILRFLAILAPALGGFIWLLKVYSEINVEPFVFIAGTFGVLFFLTIGAVYSLALGYNFRYVTLQIAKMESGYCLNIKEFMINSWERTANQWAEKYKKGRCFPPEIIKVFWFSFIIAKLLVVLAATFFLYTKCENMLVQIHTIIMVGIACIIVTLWIAPCYYGKKLSKACEDEQKEGKW